MAVMFQRYDEHARRSIFFARYEASQTGSREIGSLHLLLGLIRENESLFKQAVPAFTIDALVAECKRAIPVAKKIATNVDIPLTYESKRALAAAAEQAELMKSGMIRPLHLAIGLITVSKEVKALFSAHGVATEALGTNPDEEVENSTLSRPHSPFLEFICQGECVATVSVHFFSPVPRTGDEIYLTRNNQAETYKVLRVQHHFEDRPSAETKASCRLTKVVIEVEMIGVPPEMTGDT